MAKRRYSQRYEPPRDERPFPLTGVLFYAVVIGGLIGFAVWKLQQNWRAITYGYHEWLSELARFLHSSPQ